MELEHLEFIIQATDTKTRVTYSRDERRLRLDNVTVFTYVDDSPVEKCVGLTCGFSSQN